MIEYYGMSSHPMLPHQLPLTLITFEDSEASCPLTVLSTQPHAGVSSLILLLSTLLLGQSCSALPIFFSLKWNKKLTLRELSGKRAHLDVYKMTVISYHHLYPQLLQQLFLHSSPYQVFQQGF